MPEKRKKITNKDIYHNIIDALVENESAEFASPEEHLKAQGLDPNSLTKSGLEIVNQWKNKVRLEKRKAQYLKIRTKFDGLWSKLAVTPTNELKQTLVVLLSNNNEELAKVYWHKLEDINTTDLENMVKEQEVLDNFIDLFDGLDDLTED